MSSADRFKRSVQRLLDDNRIRGIEPSDQSALARKLEMFPAQVNKALRQAGAPSLDTLDRFAKALGTTAAALIADPSERKQPPIRDALRMVRELLAALESDGMDSPIVRELLDQVNKKPRK